MKRLLFPLIVLIALILVATFVYQAVSGPPKMLQMPEAPEVAPLSSTAFKVKSDLDFGNLNQSELMRLVEAFESASKQPRHLKEFSVVLTPGESVVTEGFVTTPGVFEFSQLTAETTDFEGKEAVLITAKRFEISLDGESMTHSAPRILTLPGVAASFRSVVRDQSGEIKEGFEMDVTSEIVEGGISLHGIEVRH